MVPFHDYTASNDEEEAPETLSLSQSRRHIQNQDDKLKKFRAAEKEKKRARNRERDRRLKEQAKQSKRKGKEAENDEGDLGARMDSAIQEAQDEMDEDEFEEEFQGSGKDEEIEVEEDVSEEYDDKEGDEESSAGEEVKAEPEVNRNPKHLPDHLFTSAFTSQPSQSHTARKANENERKQRPKKKKRVRSNALPKDMIVGSRTIRTLANAQPPSGALTIPSHKVQKFIDRTLALKGGNPKARGWERKPANIGVMRRNGPAASFVRNC